MSRFCKVLIWFILTKWQLSKIRACKPDPSPPGPPPPQQEKLSACSIGKSFKDYLNKTDSGSQIETTYTQQHTVIVEVLVAVDLALISKIHKFNNFTWSNIRQSGYQATDDLIAETTLYVRKFMSALDIKFQNHFTDPRIRFSITDVFFNSREFIVRTKNKFDMMKTYNKMKTVFGEKILSYKKGISSDVVLLLTGEESFKDFPELDEKYGITEVGRACDEEFHEYFGKRNNEQDKIKKLHHANIIVQDLGQFSGVKTATHQFGHLLGSYSDGEQSSINCCSSEGFIMSKNIYDQKNIEQFKNKRNAYKWSTCSKDAISAFVRRAPCLFNTPKEDPHPLFNWQELTENLHVPDPSHQCSIFDQETLKMEEGQSCGNDACQFLQCKTNKGSGSLVQVPGSDCMVRERQNAMEGSLCKNNKNCFQGNCINGEESI